MTRGTMDETKLGRFVRWTPVPVDMQRQLVQLLPESQPVELVEIPIAEIPSDDVLDLRCLSY